MSTTNAQIRVAPFRERNTTCASCRGAARLLITVVDAAGKHIGGTTTACQRHRQTWERRLAAQFGIGADQ